MGRIMGALAGAVSGLLAVVLVSAQFVLIAGTTMGVVREHCLDLESSSGATVDIDSGWTYVLLPPLMFANVDPAGGCVRNSPLREALAGVGVWDLPSAREQVRRHVVEQLTQPD
jgi:hypothetical protein